MNALRKVKKIHLVGVGGIGLSGLAHILIKQGKTITGADIVSSEITERFQKLGYHITLEKKSLTYLPTATQALIYSTAVPEKSTVIQKARHKNIPVLTYPEAIGEVMDGKYGIAVSGTHGKTTTTAMLATIFIQAYLDPTVIVGSKLKLLLDRNARYGKGKYMIVEGDEYKAAFLSYRPAAIILTNIETDHLDFYRNVQHIKQTFATYIRRLPEEGILVANNDDPHVRSILGQASCRVITFGMGKADVGIRFVRTRPSHSTFELKGKYAVNLTLQVPGRHNIANAAAAAIMSMALGIPKDIIRKSLKSYAGAWRRFEIKGTKRGITVIDDYAHHPTEIQATLAAVKQRFPNRRIWCIYQPHSHNRTIRLFDGFVGAFRDADKLILTEVYDVAGRENERRISAKKLVAPIKQRSGQNAEFIKNLHAIPKALLSRLEPQDVVITMGAGTITRISDDLLKLLSKEKPRS